MRRPCAYPAWLIPPDSWICESPEEATEQTTDGKTPKREPAQWRPMTELERRAALALGVCRLPPASGTKRLSGHMAEQVQRPEPVITDKQAVYLWRFAWTYRRQIMDRDVTREAKRRRNQDQGA